MNILYLINNYEKFSSEYIKQYFGEGIKYLLETNYTNEKYMNNWKRILERYPSFVPAFDEILDDCIFNNFDLETLWKNNTSYSCIRYINEKNKDECIPKIKKLWEFEYLYGKTLYDSLYKYDEENKKNYNIIFDDIIVDNLNMFEGFVFSNSKEDSIKKLTNIVNNFTKEDIEVLNQMPEYRRDFDFILKNRERFEKIGYDKVYKLIKYNEFILDKDIVSDSEFDLLWSDKFEQVTEKDFLKIKKENKLNDLKKVLDNKKFEKCKVSDLVQFALKYEDITKTLPEKFINEKNIEFILNDSETKELEILNKIFEKNSDFIGILDADIYEKIGIENYLFLFDKSRKKEDTGYYSKRERIKEIIKNGGTEYLNKELEILRNEVGLKYRQYDHYDFFRNFNAIKAKEKGYIENWIKLKELSEDPDVFYIEGDIEILNHKIIEKIGLENILKLSQKVRENVVELYEEGFFENSSANEIIQLSQGWRSLENIKVLQRLIKIDETKNKKLNYFFRV